jgi:hypothetical protein
VVGYKAVVDEQLEDGVAASDFPRGQARHSGIGRGAPQMTSLDVDAL